MSQRGASPILSASTAWTAAVCTSWAEWADWCFVVCRTDPDSQRHKGLSYLLVPMKGRGIEIRPIKQMSGGSEFAEVFYDGAKAHKDHVVGGVNNGWKVANSTLAFERGASTLASSSASTSSVVVPSMSSSGLS